MDSSSTSFLGIPLVVWGGVCLAATGVWAVVWPSDRVAGAGVVRYALVRWGHAACWACLAAMCFLRATGSPTMATLGNIVGLGSLFVYLAFMAATFGAK